MDVKIIYWDDTPSEYLDDVTKNDLVDLEMDANVYKIIDVTNGRKKTIYLAEKENKTMKKSLKEKLSPEFADLLRDIIYSIEALDEYGDIENLFSSSLWKKVWDAKERAEEILNENGLKEKKDLKESFLDIDEMLVGDVVDHFIFDCGFDKKKVERLIYKKYKLNDLDTLTTDEILKIENELNELMSL